MWEAESPTLEGEKEKQSRLSADGGTGLWTAVNRVVAECCGSCEPGLFRQRPGVGSPGAGWGRWAGAKEGRRAWGDVAWVEGGRSSPRLGQQHACEQNGQAKAGLAGPGRWVHEPEPGAEVGRGPRWVGVPPPPWSPWVSGWQVCVEQGDADPLAAGGGLDPARVLTCARGGGCARASECACVCACSRRGACSPGAGLQPTHTGISEPRLADEGADSLLAPEILRQHVPGPGGVSSSRAGAPEIPRQRVPSPGRGFHPRGLGPQEPPCFQREAEGFQEEAPMSRAPGAGKSSCKCGVHAGRSAQSRPAPGEPHGSKATP